MIPCVDARLHEVVGIQIHPRNRISVQVHSSAGKTPKEVPADYTRSRSARGCEEKHCIGMERNAAQQLAGLSLFPQSGVILFESSSFSVSKDLLYFPFYEKRSFKTVIISTSQLSLS